MHKYYIGDLCYVIEDDLWGEVCDLSSISDNEEGDLLTLKDGREFYIMSTAYGDGCYSGSDGNTYSVDSGTIGAIPVEYLQGSEKLKDAVERGLGHIVEFPYSLACDVVNENGTLYFGSLAIYTAGAPDDDDEYDVEEEDDCDSWE